MITEHESVVEEGEYSDDIYVEDVVENQGDEYGYVEVSVRVYNVDGQQLDQYIDNTQGLQNDTEWAFEVMMLEDAEDVDDYDIGVSDSRY